MNASDDQRTEENVEKISQIVREDHQLRVWMIGESMNIGKDTAWNVLHEDLSKKKSLSQGGPSGSHTTAKQIL